MSGTRPARDQRYYDPVVQTMPLERLRVLQEERLAKQLDRVWTTPVPFFKRKFEAAGVKRRDVRGLDDLRHLPATWKDELRASEEAHPPFGDYRGAPPSQAVRLGASTGTSGPADAHSLDAEGPRGRPRCVRARTMALGLRPGMSLANAHPFGMNAGGWHFSHGVEALGVTNIPSGPPVGATHVADVIEVWRRLKPDMYRSSATSRRRMPTRHAPGASIPPRSST
jgi:phenylacetate-CoA ligase